MPSPQPAERLDHIVPALRDIALWVREMGERFGSEALLDSIPFSLECLADDLAARVKKT